MLHNNPMYENRVEDGQRLDLTDGDRARKLAEHAHTGPVERIVRSKEPDDVSVSVWRR